MESILNVLQAVLGIVNEMSPYLLLGFLLAGIMHAFIPDGWYTKYLSGNTFRSVVNAAIFGVPLPLCSCGVIPTAMSLRREGASKGAVVSFLIATPQTGVDSIFAMPQMRTQRHPALADLRAASTNRMDRTPSRAPGKSLGTASSVLCQPLWGSP